MQVTTAMDTRTAKLEPLVHIRFSRDTEYTVLRIVYLYIASVLFTVMRRSSGEPRAAPGDSPELGKESCSFVVESTEAPSEI